MNCKKVIINEMGYIVISSEKLEQMTEEELNDFLLKHSAFRVSYTI